MCWPMRVDIMFRFLALPVEFFSHSAFLAQIATLLRFLTLWKARSLPINLKPSHPGFPLDLFSFGLLVKLPFEGVIGKFSSPVEESEVLKGIPESPVLSISRIGSAYGVSCVNHSYLFYFIVLWHINRIVCLNISIHLSILERLVLFPLYFVCVCGHFVNIIYVYKL